MRLQKTLFVLLATSLAFTYVGCDSSNSDEQDPEEQLDGTFTVTITGAVEKTIEGQATFGGGTDSEGNQGFVIILSQSAATAGGFAEAVWIVSDRGTRPATGTYTFTDLDDDQFGSNEVGGAYINTQGGVAATFIAQSGTLRITDSDSNKLEGTINFSGTGFVSTNPGAEGAISVTGSFSAVGGTFFAVPL